MNGTFHYVDAVVTKRLYPTHELAFGHIMAAKQIIAERVLKPATFVLARVGNTLHPAIVLNTVADHSFISVAYDNEDAKIIKIVELCVPVSTLAPASVEQWNKLSFGCRDRLYKATASLKNDSGDKLRDANSPSRERYNTRGNSSSPKTDEKKENKENDSEPSTPVDVKTPALRIDVDCAVAMSSDISNFEEIGTQYSALIQSGQYFEIEDQYNPKIVHLVQVITNSLGLLHAQKVFNDGDIYINYLSPRVHPVGWCTSETGTAHMAKYSEPIDQTAMQHFRDHAVPLRAFQQTEKRNTHRHNFEVGMRCELLDPINQVEFKPVAVTEVVSPYYFRVEYERLVSTEEASTSDTAVLCTRQSPNLFPARFCERNSLRMQPPEGYRPRVDDNRGAEFTWAQFRLDTNLTTFDQSTDAQFFKRSQNAKLFAWGSQLEVVDPLYYNSGAPFRFLPATVCRTHRTNFVIVRFNNAQYYDHARFYDAGSLDLYPCGFAQAHGLPIAPIANLPEQSIQFALPKAESYTDERTHPFIENDKYYIPRKCNLDAVPWAPRLYINTSCHLGPYFTKSGFGKNTIQYYDACPIDMQAGNILKDLLQATNKQMLLLEMIKSRSFYNSCLKTTVKMKHKRHVRNQRKSNYLVAVPFKAAHLPDYLYHLLTMLDCCPMLISPMKIDQQNACPYKCAELIQCNRWADASNHALTGYKANVHGKQGKQRGNRWTAESRWNQQADHLRVRLAIAKRQKPTDYKPTKRQRLNDDDTFIPEIEPVNENRRPVTRGVRRPTIKHKLDTSPPATSSTQMVATKLQRTARRHLSQSHHNRPTDIRSRFYQSPPLSKQLERTKIAEQIRAKPIVAVQPRRKFNADHTSSMHKSSIMTSPSKSTASVSSTASKRITDDEEEDLFVELAHWVPPVCTDPGDWDTGDLLTWLKPLRLNAKTMDALRKEDFDGHSFMLLALEDSMNFLQLSYGAALRLHTVVTELRAEYFSKYANVSP